MPHMTNLTQLQQLAIDSAIDAIEAQQQGKEGTPAWMVGEQLKDICRNEPENADIIAQDLTVEAMSIVHAERKLKAWADKKKSDKGHKGNCVCITPVQADEILRTFYGLTKPTRPVAPVAVVANSTDNPPSPPPNKTSDIAFDLADFL